MAAICAAQSQRWNWKVVDTAGRRRAVRERYQAAKFHGRWRWRWRYPGRSAIKRVILCSSTKATAR